MDAKFLLLVFFLFLFQFRGIKSDDSALNNEISNVVKQILEEYNIEDNPSEYANSTISLLNQAQELNLANELTSLKLKKMTTGTHLLDHIVQIIKCRTNVTRQITKMLANIEELRYYLIQAYKKEHVPNIDDLLYFDVSEQMSKEYLKTLNQLASLKHRIHEWDKSFRIDDGGFDAISSLVSKFAHNEDIPEMVWKEVDEEVFPEIDPDEEDSKVEKIKRLSLLLEDEINETPKDNLAQEHAWELYTPELPEGEKLPRWLLTEKDIEEIRDKYLKWMFLFENSESPVIAEMKEAIESSGKSLKLFCKNIAEYFNLTTILLECTAKDDSECEEMVMQILKQPSFKEFIQFFSKYSGQDLPNIF